jgi:hypothetical protein
VQGAKLIRRDELVMFGLERYLKLGQVNWAFLVVDERES